MEENRTFSWTDLFMKVIIIILFVLFTVWLLSLSNKDMSNSLDVLTNNIFAENMDRMKEVGKEYFTVERLPEKVGEIETLTLKEMYEKKLILEVTDKNGSACDAEDSYVAVEKLDDEYQMKVNLKCGSEEKYIIVIMGCYNYCNTDICEKVEVITPEKEIEYQYKKVTNGSWTDYGKWSEWSKVSVSKSDYRQVETKKETEKYTYDKVVTETLFEKVNATCPNGYKITADGSKCYKEEEKTTYADPVCEEKSGWTLVRDGFTCNYSKTEKETVTFDAECPSGYVQSGSKCVKTIESDMVNPTCPPAKDGYIMVERNGFTCNYRKYVNGDYVTTKTGSYVPKNTDSYMYQEVGSAEYVYQCDNKCAFVWVHTYKVYKTKADIQTEKAVCPTGYNPSGSVCVKTSTDTKEPTCPTKSGYTYVLRNGFDCTYTREVPRTTTGIAYCPNGFDKLGNTCGKTIINPLYKDLIKSCRADYKLTSDETKCYNTIEKTVQETGTKEVTYYRYRVRECVGGTTDYKWSKSKEDKDLLKAGYKLTGKTR